MWQNNRYTRADGREFWRTGEVGKLEGIEGVVYIGPPELFKPLTVFVH